jgi:hypothetical protein
MRNLSMVLASVLCITGCSAPKLAAELATVTSGHVSTLNGELKQYADSANAARQRDAQRIAAAQGRWDQDNSYNQRFLTEWQIDRKSLFSSAFEALQKQSDAEMAITDSYLKRQNDAATELTKTYGQLSYNPSQLQGVIAALQPLIARPDTKQQIEAIRDFASTTVADAKKELTASQPVPKVGAP